jgi:hypothetical protein
MHDRSQSSRRAGRCDALSWRLRERASRDFEGEPQTATTNSWPRDVVHEIALRAAAPYNQSMRLAITALVLVSAIAAASTKVTVTSEKAGYTTGLHSLIGKAADEAAERAELARRLAANDKRLAAAYKQFATGKHPYTATRKLLDARRTREGTYATVRYEGFSIDLHLAAGASEVAAQRAAADFTLAQLSPGGDLAGARGDVCANDADQHFTRGQLFNFALDGASGAVGELLWARNCKSQIKRFVTRPPPDSAYQKLDKEDVARAAPRSRLVGVAQGRALLAFLEQRPYVAADLAALDALDASDAERVARNMVLLLPASRQSWITKDLLPYLQKQHPTLVSGAFGTWLAAIARL